MCILKRDEAAQIQVHLHHLPIYQLNVVDVEVRGVGGRGEVEVGEDTPHLGEGGQILS